MKRSAKVASKISDDSISSSQPNSDRELRKAADEATVDKKKKADENQENVGKQKDAVDEPDEDELRESRPMNLWPDWYKHPMPMSEATSLRLKASGRLTWEDWKEHALRLQKEREEVDAKLEKRELKAQELKDSNQAFREENAKFRRINDSAIRLRECLIDNGFDIDGLLRRIPS